MRESPTLIIEAGKIEQHYWRTLWSYRELLLFLAWRDILVRYKQTSLGVLWALIRPALTMLALSLVFGKLANFPSGNTPYGIFVLAALIPWQFFANSFADSGNSLINNASMMSKIYFPRMIIPISAVLVSVLDLIFAIILFTSLMLWFDISITWHILILPGLFVLTFFASIGAGLWASALSIRYRDFRHLIPFSVQFGFFISPIGFPSALVPDSWQTLFSLNPMVGLMNSYRWALLPGSETPPWNQLLLSASLIVLIFSTGITYFRRAERNLTDII